MAASLEATDEATVVNATRYDAWGETIGTGSAGGSAVGAGAWKYQGRLDVSPAGLATPLYDMSARLYAPGIGAFTSLDSVMGAAQNPLSMNRFLYAHANPATLIDPSGHAALEYDNYSTPGQTSYTTSSGTTHKVNKQAPRPKYRAGTTTRRASGCATDERGCGRARVPLLRTGNAPRQVVPPGPIPTPSSSLVEPDWVRAARDEAMEKDVVARFGLGFVKGTPLGLLWLPDALEQDPMGTLWCMNPLNPGCLQRQALDNANALAYGTNGDRAEVIGGWVGMGTTAVVATGAGSGARAPAATSPIVRINQAAGEAWAHDVMGNLLPRTQTNIVPEISIRSSGPSGLKSRLDAVGSDADSGAVKLSEMKGSATAPLTYNQRIVYPELAIYGGVVVGKGKWPFVGGTVIPPTPVDIIRKYN